MKRAIRFFGSAFGVAVLGCLALAGWAVWSAGAFDGPVARQLRTSPVYAAPGIPLDQAAAERVVGNRRLVVAFLEPGSDLSATCASLGNAADGTLALMLSRDGDDYEKYGCSRLPGDDAGTFGKSFVSEQLIGNGVDGFTARPLDALKVAVVNYDLLVKAGTVPDGARTVSPSLPRYLVAVAAVTAVLLGAAALYLAGHRAARTAVARRERRDAEADAHAELAAAAAVLAQEIIDLDARYARATPAAESGFTRGYRRLVADYTALLPQLAEPGTDVPKLTRQLEEMLRRARNLAAARSRQAARRSASSPR